MIRMLLKMVSTGTVTRPKKGFKSTPLDQVGENLKKTIHSLYGGRALRIRHIDAGSTNGEEYEMTALNNAYYDVERFGLSFVASPRHADILTVSGPVTRNMEHALKTAYDMTPNPKIVVAVGDGAITGGMWRDSYAVVGAVKKVIPVDYEIAGDPPSPSEILTGLLRALESATQ